MFILMMHPQFEIRIVSVAIISQEIHKTVVSDWIAQQAK